MADRDTVSLGPTGLRVGAVGLGTNGWRSEATSVTQLGSALGAALEAGITFVDTAEIYGSGGSERALGACLKGSPGAVVGTKFFPMPWRLGRAALVRALRASLRLETWMAAMAEAVSEGLVGAVGVSNYGPERLRRAHAALAARGIPLASNEVELNLLSRGVESDGLLGLCRELGVTVIAYRPLALGLLAQGEGGDGHKPRGWRGLLFGRAYERRVEAVADLLRDIGGAHGGRTPSQVALNWVVCKGAVPIPGARSVRHVRENAAAMGWRLKAEEVSALDEAAAAV
jgi:aryl-alcohol dehydrogenase-like predicted oxidoreductase